MTNLLKSIGKAAKKGLKSQVQVAKKVAKGMQRANASTQRFSNTMQTSGLGAAVKGAKRDIKSDYHADKEDIREARKGYHDAAGEAINAHQDYQRAWMTDLDKAQRPLARKIGVSESAINQVRDIPLAIESLSSGDARLLNATKNANSGVFSGRDNDEAARKDAEGLGYVKTIGGIAARSNIPIVQWIGLAANAVANARLSGAGLQSNKQGFTNAATTYLTSGTGTNQIGSTLGVSKNVAQGLASGATGAINAKAAGGDSGDMAKAAALGYAGSQAGNWGAKAGGAIGDAIGVSKDTAKIIGAGVSGGLGGAIGGVAAGQHGSDLLQTTLGGALGSATGAYGKAEGWDPYLYKNAQRLVTAGVTGQKFNPDVRSALGQVWRDYGKPYWNNRSSSGLGGMFSRTGTQPTSPPPADNKPTGYI